MIDDDPQVRSFVADVLRTDGWTVSEAISAEQSFEMLPAQKWAIVFCDVMMGGADGYAVLRRFTESQPDTRFVLMTGHGSAAGALDATAIGAYDYLIKPFAVDDILNLAQSVQEKPSRYMPRSFSEIYFRSILSFISKFNLVTFSGVETTSLTPRSSRSPLSTLPGLPGAVRIFFSIFV